MVENIQKENKFNGKIDIQTIIPIWFQPIIKESDNPMIESSVIGVV